MMTVITQSVAAKVLSVVDKGLVRGIGQPIPGQMCVEAAVCYALSQEHGDRPSCVEESLIKFKIVINDSTLWSSNQNRAKGLRRLAIAQLGTVNNFNQNMFLSELIQIISFYTNVIEMSQYMKISLSCINYEKFDNSYRIFLCAYYLNNIARSYGFEMEEHIFTKMCEEVVQILVKMNTPGSKFLYLTE